MSFNNDIESQVTTGTNQIVFDENDHVSSKKSNEDCLFCCGACSICILTLGLIAGCVSYLVFGIMFLVQDYDVADSCEDSSLWAYVLTAIILCWGRVGVKNNSTNNEESGACGILCTLLCLGLIETGLAIWGGTELWQKSCDDLSDTHLWKFGLATFCIQTCVAGLFIVIIPCYLCVYSIFYNPEK